MVNKAYQVIDEVVWFVHLDIASILGMDFLAYKYDPIMHYFSISSWFHCLTMHLNEKSRCLSMLQILTYLLAWFLKVVRVFWGGSIDIEYIFSKLKPWTFLYGLFYKSCITFQRDVHRKYSVVCNYSLGEKKSSSTSQSTKVWCQRLIWTLSFSALANVSRPPFH